MYTKTALLLAAALPTISAFLFPMPATHRGVSMAPMMELGRTARSPASVVSAVVSAGASRTQAKGQDEDRELTLADVKGSNTDAAWGEVPEELYFVANYAAAIGGDYPPENVDKSYWDQIKDSTYSKLAALAKTADPSTISPGQYVILCESVVREAIKADPKKQRPTIAAPELTPQQNYAYDWANSISNEEFVKFKKEYRIEDMSPQEWWAKIDEVAADNAAKGIKLPELTVDLTADPLLGVAREEFVKSIRQFLKVESEMFPVFIITNPGSEEGTKLVDLFNKTLDIPTRFYEVYGFDAFKFKIKSAYDWGEARLEAIEQLTGTRELPVVYVNGTYIGGPEQVMAKYQDGSLKKTTDALRDEIIAMVQERFPPQQGESMYIGMKKVTPEEYKAYQDNLAKTGGLDPLEASRQKAKEAAQAAGQKK